MASPVVTSTARKNRVVKIIYFNNPILCADFTVLPKHLLAGNSEQTYYVKIVGKRLSFGVKHHWSSSPNANNSNNAWKLNFNNGNDNNNNYMRLVRGGK